MQPSFVVEAMITAGVRLKRLMECLAACLSWENKHGDPLTSISIDSVALRVMSITFCARIR